MPHLLHGRVRWKIQSIVRARVLFYFYFKERGTWIQALTHCIHKWTQTSLTGFELDDTRMIHTPREYTAEKSGRSNGSNRRPADHLRALRMCEYRDT